MKDRFIALEATTYIWYKRAIPPYVVCLYDGTRDAISATIAVIIYTNEPCHLLGSPWDPRGHVVAFNALNPKDLHIVHTVKLPTILEMNRI